MDLRTSKTSDHSRDPQSCPTFSGLFKGLFTYRWVWVGEANARPPGHEQSVPSLAYALVVSHVPSQMESSFAVLHPRPDGNQGSGTRVLQRADGSSHHTSNFQVVGVPPVTARVASACHDASLLLAFPVAACLAVLPSIPPCTAEVGTDQPVAQKTRAKLSALT